MHAVVAGAGSALPETVIENDHFAGLGLTDKWISSRTGIHRRRRLAEGEKLSDLAVTASQRALADAGLSAREIDFVVVATLTPDRASPSLATELGWRIDAPNCGAVDVNGACTGFLYALDYAVAKIEAGRATAVLVCGAEATSRIVDPTDLVTAPLFGDGAGAIIVTGSDRPCACRISIELASDGSQEQILTVRREDPVLRMDGIEVYQMAIETMVDAVVRTARAGGIPIDAIDLLVPHQANSRIVGQVAEQLGVPAERAALYLSEIGNTSAASIPIALDLAQADGRIPPGTKVMLAAFGAGATWGAALLDWKGCLHQAPSPPSAPTPNG
ncbi:beta-ketoacyl-ACP synthase 3 [Kribbella sp. NPDC051718]|uniref:beta-ketoacyl-ACP synthase 3 n=1 Tax=Kribbella sp. NPDC051718 TaxID=3155168 RepID=UPI00342975B2